MKIYQLQLLQTVDQEPGRTLRDRADDEWINVYLTIIRLLLKK